MPDEDSNGYVDHGKCWPCWADSLCVALVSHFSAREENRQEQARKEQAGEDRPRTKNDEVMERARGLLEEIKW